MSRTNSLPENRCSVCRTADVMPFVEILQVPIHCNVLWPSHEEAVQAPRGDIRLGFCQDCGHIFNLAFNPMLMEYTQVYENSLHFSPRFQSYAESSATRLIDRYDLHSKHIIDIGCGKGDFLKLICKLGNNHGTGFDPSYVPDQNEAETAEQVNFILDFYSDRYASYKADLICCRHVLEHIQFPRKFISNVRLSIGDDYEPAVFFEVPNVMFTLRDLGIWDLIYEHCSYFSISSLSYLFSQCGFDVQELIETYEGQFLCLDAWAGNGSVDSKIDPRQNFEELSNLVSPFGENYRKKVARWRHELEELKRSGRRVVIWGGGSKGVTFLNVLQTQDKVGYIVDINSRKQGMYVAGTGQKIVPPEFLRDYRPDIVIIMNSIYQNEIERAVSELGITPEFMSV